MSDMLRAREMMDEAYDMISRACLLTARAKQMNETAMGLMEDAKALTFRASPVRRAPAEWEFISQDTKQQVIDMAGANPAMTYHEIAEAVGLRNGGRVSEIMTGKR